MCNKMKLVTILGPHAVGKMTVGQELAAITGLKLFHNHMTIELVANFFDPFASTEGRHLKALFRKEIFEAVANSDLPGLILTSMLDFDKPARYKGLDSTLEIFQARGAEIYVVELIADFDVRIQRNKTENRLQNKPSKRDIKKSEELFRVLESEHRFNSKDKEGEELFTNYFRLDNTNIPPGEAAMIIKKHFAL